MEIPKWTETVAVYVEGLVLGPRGHGAGPTVRRLVVTDGRIRLLQCTCCGVIYPFDWLRPLQNRKSHCGRSSWCPDCEAATERRRQARFRRKREQRREAFRNSRGLAPAIVTEAS